MDGVPRTEAEVEAYMAEYNAKMHPQAQVDEKDIPDSTPESKLQQKAERWLNERGYPYIHDRSRGKNKSGQILDLHIYLPKGRHVVVELKAKGNKMSNEQKETYQKILFLGHEVHEVRSFKRFLEIMEGKQ